MTIPSSTPDPLAAQFFRAPGWRSEDDAEADEMARERFTDLGIARTDAPPTPPSPDPGTIEVATDSVVINGVRVPRRGSS